MSEVSIILGAYNGEEVIEKQLDSIFANSYKDIEVIVSDDGSTDHTEQVVREYIAHHPNCQLTWCPHEKNQGYVLNFLTAAKQMESPYFMFCDQDDIWYEDKIEKTLRKMKETEGNEIHVPTAIFTDNCIYDVKTGEKSGSFHQNGKLDVNRLDFCSLLMENKLIGCTMMMNQAVRMKLTTIPKSARVHDWWIALICASMGKISYLPEMTMLYCQYGNNMIGSHTFGSYFHQRITHLREQKEAIRKTILQASEFCAIYEEELSQENLNSVKAFCQLGQAGKLKRMRIIHHYGFTKTGLMRNIGLYFLI